MRLASVAAIGVVCAGLLQAGEHGGSAILCSPGDLRWSEDPNINGGLYARLLGDGTRPHEADVMMLRWKPGTYVPPHRHPRAVCSGVVLEGTLLVETACAEVKQLPAGSYFSLGGGMVHSLRCSPEGKGCLIYWARPNSSDTINVDCSAPKPAADPSTE